MRRRAAVAVVLAVVVTLAAGACSRTRDALDTRDRERFVEASDALTRSYDELAAQAQALTGPDDIPAFVVTADEEILAMETQAAELADLAEALDGRAREIATEAAGVATDLVATSREVVVALQNGDEAALAAAFALEEQAIASFNEQIEAWNEL